MSSTSQLTTRVPGKAAKGFRAGTHRLIPPAETLARVTPLMPAMGITRVANITGLDCIGIPVVVACRPNSRSLAVSQGKGLDLDAAKASALMESIEAYHAERITLPLKLGSYDELQGGHNLVDVSQLPRTPNGLYSSDLPMLWVEGRDVLQEESVWLPFELVHTNYTLRLRVGAGVFNTSTNGLASGNHPFEALSHAICEVVERDATTLWYLRGAEAQRRTRLDLDTVSDPGCREVLDKFERAGVAVAVWETTSDVGIASFLCMIMERDENPLRLLYAATGMGCHPSRPVALLRALTEAAQSRLTAITGSRDDLTRKDYEHYRNLDALRQNRAQMEADGPAKSFDEGPSQEGESFEDDVAWELERLRAIGIERVVAVDLTKPEFGIPVVRVVIPGLEGISSAAGYACGRRALSLLKDL